jgi:hypothetical protein
MTSSTRVKGTKSLSVESVLQLCDTPNSALRLARRVAYADCSEAFFEEHVVQAGQPLVLSRANAHWPRDVADLFTPLNLRHSVGPMLFTGRDNDANCDLQQPVASYLDYVDSGGGAGGGGRGGHGDALVYGKDIPTPAAWSGALERVLPAHWVAGQGDDMFALLPRTLRPEVMLVYHGVAGTTTAGHFDICSSIGHNVFVWGDRPDACALWFMVESKDRDNARQFWLANGGNLDHDNHFLSPHVLSKAPFPIHVVKQIRGDFVLVPPDGAHQVVNCCGTSMKVAWNRLPPRCLRLAHERVLPKLRAQGKAEVYRIQTTAWYGLGKTLELVESGALPVSKQTLERVEILAALVRDNVAGEAADMSDVLALLAAPVAQRLRALIALKAAAAADDDDDDDVSVTIDGDVAEPNGKERAPAPLPLRDQTSASIFERVLPKLPRLSSVRETCEVAHTRSCDFCKCDLWNRYVHCNACSLHDDSEGFPREYDLCLACVSVGRGCTDAHFAHYEFRETVPEADIAAMLKRADDTLAWLRSASRPISLLSLAQRRVIAARVDDSIMLTAKGARDDDKLPASACGAQCGSCRAFRPYELSVPCRCALSPPQLVGSEQLPAAAAACGAIICETCLWNTHQIAPARCLRERLWVSPVCQRAAALPPSPPPLATDVCASELPFHLLHATGFLGATRLGIADTLPEGQVLRIALPWYDADDETSRRRNQRDMVLRAQRLAADESDEVELLDKANVVFADDNKDDEDNNNINNNNINNIDNINIINNGGGGGDLRNGASASASVQSESRVSRDGAIARQLSLGMRQRAPRPKPSAPKVRSAPKATKRAAPAAASSALSSKSASKSKKSASTPKRRRADDVSTVEELPKRLSRADWMAQATVPCQTYCNEDNTPADLPAVLELLWAPMADGRWFPCVRIDVADIDDDPLLIVERQELLERWAAITASVVDREEDDKQGAADLCPVDGVALVQFFGNDRMQWVHRYRKFYKSDGVYCGMPAPRDVAPSAELYAAIAKALEFASEHKGVRSMFARGMHFAELHNAVAHKHRAVGTLKDKPAAAVAAAVEAAARDTEENAVVTAAAAAAAVD